MTAVGIGMTPHGEAAAEKYPEISADFPHSLEMMTGEMLLITGRLR